ncbi:MAG: tRNA 2-thiocytidine biosynthesis TtcA family protein [Clostridia bacterium]
MRKTTSYLRRAINDYDMIKDGDIIGVGVSGGKDSMVLLAGLNSLLKFVGIDFKIIAITLKLGFETDRVNEIERYCKDNGIRHEFVDTEIGNIVFDYRKESNPCSLCAKMRRGAINEYAKKIGCNKVALGHNFDDVVETVFLNLYYEGRFGCFAPVTYLDRVDITVIRPLIYMEETAILGAAKRNNLPIVKSCCPANGTTKREEMKEHIKLLQQTHKDIKNKIFKALCKAELNGWRVQDKGRCN